MDRSLMATFTRREEATDAAKALREAHPELDVAAGDQEDALDALALNQRVQMAEAAPVGPGGMWSGPMMRGALVGAAVGFVAGAILILPILALVDWPAGDRVLFAVVVAIAGGIALSSATVIIGMVRRAQREGEFTPEDPWAVVRVRSTDGGPWSEETVDIVSRELVESGARSVRRVSAPVQRPPTEDVETPRSFGERPPADDWPASQAGSRSTSA